MSENDSNDDIGYVTENTEMATRGLLVLYSVTGGRVLYDNYASLAQELELGRAFVPDIRRLRDSFAIAKNNLDGLDLPTLEVAEGWDGTVQRSVKITSLKRSNEYVVQIECRGRSRGKNHVERQNMFRLEFSPPEEFDERAWREGYINQVWNEVEEDDRVSTDSLAGCLSVTPYWDDSDIDALLLGRIVSTLNEEFAIVAVSIDQKMLRDRVVRVLSSELGGLPFRSGQGAYYLVRPNDEEAATAQLTTLENYSRLLEAFGNANALVGENAESNWFGEDGRPRNWHRPQTNLRIMGYIDNERQMSYIRRDIETNIGREIGEYQQKLMEVARSFDDEKVEAFGRRLDAMRGTRAELLSRLSSLSSAVGGVNPSLSLYRDVSDGINEAVTRISGSNSAIASRLAALSDLTQDEEE